MIFGREPARWIGLTVTIILGILSALTKDGLVSDALAGRVTDIVQSAAQLLILLAPIITAEVVRTQTTSTRFPRLKVGTDVLVTTQEGKPHSRTTIKPS